MFKTIIKTIFACATAAAIALWVLQHNARFNEVTLAKLITVLEHELDASIVIERSQLNALTGWVELYNGTITDRKSPLTSIAFERAHIQIGKLMFLVRQKIDLYITAHNVTLTSDKDKSGYTLPAFLTRLAAGSSEKDAATVQSLTVHAITITTAEQCNPSIEVTLPGALTALHHHRNHWWYCSLISQGGTTRLNKVPLLTEMTIDGMLTAGTTQNSGSYTLKATSKSFLIGDQNQLTLQGRHDVLRQQLLITSTDGKVYNYLTALGDHLYHTAHLPLELVERFCTLLTSKIAGKEPSAATVSDGTLLVKSKWCLNNLFKGKGTVTATDLALPGVNHGRSTLHFTSTENRLRADGTLNFDPAALHLTAAARWKWKEEEATIHLKNDSHFTPFKEYVHTLQPLELLVTLTAHDQLKGHAECLVKTPLTGKESIITAQLFSDERSAHTNVNLPHGELLADFDHTQALQLDRLLYVSNGIKQYELKRNPQHPQFIDGIVRYRFARSLLPAQYKHYLLGSKGLFKLRCNDSNWPQVTGSCALVGGKLFIPNSSNLITDCSARVSADCEQRTAQLSSFEGRCSVGSITSPEIALAWNKELECTFVHAPLTINDLLINWKKDFYGLVYGNLFARYCKGQQASLQGDLIIRKSLLKENIFAHAPTSFSNFASTGIFPKNQSLNIDLTVMTEEPLSAKTPTIQTTASAKLHIKGVIDENGMSNPFVKGAVVIHKGTLSFLRHKLFITQGKIHFLPQRMNDPMIDFTAQNRIKKYLVSLQISGTAQSPTIVLESTPELTEEQILALLLSGSEHASLQAELPSIIMQNLSTLLLGGKSLQPSTSKFFTQLAKPFQYIQITPKFTDQTGRGGIKGTVSVDITPQLHAQIQKDINLQEDLAFQVEYYFTDNFNVKAIRDTRGDLGAQAEWSLKF